MSLILSCNAAKVDDKSIVVELIISDDFRPDREKIKTYVLPTEREAFAKGILNWWGNTKKDIIPWKFNKQNDGSNPQPDSDDTGKGARYNLQKLFIEYTKQQATRVPSAGPDAVALHLDEYYDSLFMPGPEDIPKLDKLTERAMAKMEAQSAITAAKQKKQVAEYCANEFGDPDDDASEEACEDKAAMLKNAGTTGWESPPFEPQTIIGHKAVGNNLKPKQNFNNISQADRLKKMQGKGIVDESGIQGNPLREAVPPPYLDPMDGEVRGNNNSGLICSRDENYRWKGNTGAGACYLYAGRSPHDKRVEEITPGETPLQQKSLRKGNDLVADAAYIYLSQMSDAKAVLGKGIAGGEYRKRAGDRIGLSLAAVKADDVVIMSRVSGIRLITHTDKKGTQGYEPLGVFGIELIAGNDDSDLQPLVKGDNLRVYLKGLSDSLDKLSSVVYGFMTSQLTLNAALASHTHYDPFCIFLGTMTGNPLGVLGGKNMLSPEVLSAGGKAMLDQIKGQQGAINQAFSRINNDINGLEQFGQYYINSEKNRTN
tara:strand:+ start:31 stop:1656 length:1626 start_codon:yes stop_codon:yes gene_type:complete